MAYYYRRWRNNYWKRRQFRWRRPRRPFRRRRWHKRWVRKKKLSYLRLKEWQPKVIRKLCVKGMYCLFECNHNLLTRNYTQYMESIPAEGTPSGGGFSLNKFTLDCLYSEHEKARNVWTKGNKNLPLIRYTGCEFKIYRPTNTDAVVKFQTCYPMSATPLTYTSTQPYIMMMSQGSKKISRLENTKNKKPYKKFKFKPPQQMTNKWFFSTDLANKGLIMLASTAANFENIYISKYAESNTISLRFLNTQIFKNRHFNKLPTSGYHAKQNMWLWAAKNGNTPPKLKEMIFLGNTVQYRLGTPIENYYPTGNIQTLLNKSEFMKLENWGNPFHENYLNHKHQLWWTTSSPTTHLSSHKDKQVTETVTNLGFNKLEQELFFYGRYNPNRDKGENTQLYYLKNFEEETGWAPPPNKNLIISGFPLWLLVWGNLDYQLKLAEINHIETNYITCIQTDKIEPTIPPQEAYILLDSNFTHGDSEWHDEHGRTDYDEIHWFPQVNYQKRTLENIGKCGPATAKLGQYKNAELHCEYKFYFKVGGCVPPMDKITDPSLQPTYPIPTNIADPNSLQNPREPIETFLYCFDERRGQITETAAQRITKDIKPTKTLFTDSITTGTDVPVLQTFQETQDSEEEEETQEATLFQQLQQQRIKQHNIRRRIQQLLTQLQQLS
nr:MAG: ORF1 [TTV-like mini virus]